MKKASVMSTIFFLFIFVTGCVDEKIIQVTVNPSAQPLLKTMTVIASTVEVIAQSATAYSIPPPATDTPTKLPDPGEVNKTIKDEINNQLISTFGASISVVDVKFGPIGAQDLTYLYIEMECVGYNNAVCPTTQVIIAVVDACKAKKKKIIENVPKTTQVLTITIFDPVTRPTVVEANWSDVLAYLNDEVTAEIFSRLVRSFQY